MRFMDNIEIPLLQNLQEKELNLTIRKGFLPIKKETIKS